MSSWARQPFLGLALAASVGIAVADRWPNRSLATIVVVALLALGALIVRKSAVTYGFIAGAFFILHSTRIENSPGQQFAREFGAGVSAVTAEGIVVSEPKTTPKGFSTFLFQLDSVEAQGVSHPAKATLRARWKGTAQFGDRLRLFGGVESIAPPRNPGEFDMRAYLARRDVGSALIVRYAENGRVLAHTSGNFILRAAQISRRWMQRTLDRDLADAPDVRGLIDGMVLGLRHETPEDIEEPFQQTGTLHLFAVAGLHVGIVAQLLRMIAAVARVPRKWATALIIPALLFYAAITGLHTSSVRAAIMASVLLAGVFVERRVFALNSLAAAAFIILALDSNELFAVGFQLSFAVVGMIILLATPAAHFFRRFTITDPFLPRGLFGPGRKAAEQLLHWLARAAAVSFAAWIGSLPLMLWYYHLVTPISLAANLFVIPVAFAVLATGLLSLLAAPCATWLSLLFNNANWAFAKLIFFLVNVFAFLPSGHLYVARPHWPEPAHTEITVLDAGSGGAIHLRNGRTDWLFDAGAARDYHHFLREYLRSRGINRLDGLLLTHGDSGHVGGALSVGADFAPRQIVDFNGHDRSRIHSSFLADLARRHAPLEFRAAGAEWKITPSLTARVLTPSPGTTAPAADDQALVVQLVRADGGRVLLMSDSGAATEAILLAGDQAALRSEILIKGQNRLSASASPQFLDAVKPRLIIATAQEVPEAERIPEEWADEVRRRGIHLARLDETGAVTVKIFRHHFEARSFLHPETFWSESR